MMQKFSVEQKARKKVKEISDEEFNKFRRCVACPKCQISGHINKDGKSSGYQRFVCTKCKQSFGSTLFASSVEAFSSRKRALSDQSSEPDSLEYTSEEEEEEEEITTQSSIQSTEPQQISSSITLRNPSDDQQFHLNSIAIQNLIETSLANFMKPIITQLANVQNILERQVDLLEQTRNSVRTLSAKNNLLEEKMKKIESQTLENTSHAIQSPSVSPRIEFPTTPVKPTSHRPARLQDWQSVKPPSKASYASVVIENLPDRYKEAGAELIRSCNRFDALSQLSMVPNLETEVTTKKRLVYIYGFQFCHLKDLKKKLFNFGFRMSSIFNLQFIGKRVLEFLIAEEYYVKFIETVGLLGKFVQVIDKFDARVVNKAGATVEDNEFAAQQFALRAVRNIVNGKPSVRDFFQRMVEESGTSVKKLVEKELKKVEKCDRKESTSDQGRSQNRENSDKLSLQVPNIIVEQSAIIESNMVLHTENVEEQSSEEESRERNREDSMDIDQDREVSPEHV